MAALRESPSMGENAVKTTPLHDRHLTLKARMAEFAGYDMPIQYETGVLAEHNWTRESCGLFDVSHMGQVFLEGAGAAALWEKLTPSAISKLKDGTAKYTVMTNENGGIIDDLIITRLSSEKFFAVINAGCKDKDIAWIQSNLRDDTRLFHLDDRSLLALQGPKAETVLREVLGVDASGLGYMKIMDAAPYLISRLGYTGEDGVEISVANKDVAVLWDKFLQHPDVKPIGLAARDSLRLEMGYPLYGHDITSDTSPVEADLVWVMGKDQTGYIGHEKIAPQLTNGTKRIRLGIRLTGQGVAREGAEILTVEGKKIGEFTSGGFSPTLNQSIGMGYVETDHKAGDEVLVRVRGRDIKAVLTAFPFVTPKTKTAKQKAA
jgi:aminomethyltransferase